MPSPLASYIPSPDKPWNRRRAAHLLRRTGFGASVAEIENTLSRGPSATVDALIDACVAQAPIPKPSWAETGGPFPGWTGAQIAAEQAQRAVWTNEFRTNLTSRILRTGLHGRLTLFWHSHFATEYTDYFLRPQFAYRYIDLIQRNTLGNFKNLTHDMGLTPAMLLYLNGNLNTRTAPNENYARELLELHTLGEGNGYTQRDIEELARALTGFTVRISYLEVVYDNTKFDNWNKTIFGTWENFNYSTAINHLFTAKRELIAQYVCRRLYTHFVHATADETVVDAMALLLLDNDWRVEPVLRALFKSEAFFEDGLIGARISSPFELLGGYLNSLGVTITTLEASTVLRLASSLSEDLLQPPNVAGWPGHRDWLDTSLLPTRWNSLNTLLMSYGWPLLDYAKRFPESGDAYALAAAIGEHILSVPLSEERKRELGDILLAGTPAYEWNVNSSYSRLLGLMTHLFTLPEYQLT